MSFTFQLYKKSYMKDDNHRLISIKIGINNFQFVISQLTQCTDFGEIMAKQAKVLSNDDLSKVFMDWFQNKIDNSPETKNIDKVIKDQFIKILAGESVSIYISNFYDFYKLSKIFQVPKLQEEIKKECSYLYHPSDILPTVKITDEEEPLFNEFIKYVNIEQKLSDDAEGCLSKNSFLSNLPKSTIFNILKGSKRIISSFSEKIYDMIAESFEERLHFLPFVDFSQLLNDKRSNLFKSLIRIENKLKNAVEDDQQKTQKMDQGSNCYNKQQINEMKDRIEKLEKENKILAKKLSQKSTSESDKTQNPSKNIDVKKQKQSHDSIFKTYSGVNPLKKPKNIDKPSKQTKSKMTKDHSSNSLDSDHDNDSPSYFKDDDYNGSDYSSYDYGIVNSNSHKNDDDDTTFLKKKHKKKAYKRTQNTHHITQKNRQRIEIFEENADIVKKGTYKTFLGGPFDIKDDLKYSIKNTEIIKKRDNLHFSKKTKYELDSESLYSLYSKVKVTSDSTFAAAIAAKFISRKVCVLNFASATQPGGGVLNGRNAQEEVLSRQSTLYFSLEKQKSFYDYNNNNPNPFGTDYMIYSPNVLIIRDDNDLLIKPCKVSVISSVAVNNAEVEQKYPSIDKRSDVYDIMKKRCRRILELCISRGNDIIVLGAFGCGVFKNSPKMISEIFKKLLIEEKFASYFTEVIFAIKIKPKENPEMINAFRKAFTYKPMTSLYYPKI